MEGEGGMEARFLTRMAAEHNLRVCSIVSLGWPQSGQKSGRLHPRPLRLVIVGRPLWKIFQMKNLILT